MKTLTPNEKQIKAIQLWKDSGGLLLHGATGSGKTLVGVEGIAEIDMPVNLIVGPLHVFTSWARTLKNQTGHVLRHVHRKNKAGKETEADILKGVPGHYFIGTQLFQRIEWNAKNIDVFVWDECHALANRNSKTFKAAKKFRSVPYKLGLSATPAGSKFEGFWSVSKFLFPHEIDNSFWRWVSKWATTEYDPYVYKKVTGEQNPGAFVNSLPGYTQMPSPHVGEVTHKYIDVDLNQKQLKAYKLLENESIAFYDDNPEFVELPAVLYTRLLQSTLATPKITSWVDEFGENRSTAEFPPETTSSKADIFFDLLKSIGKENIVVFSHSRIFIEYLHNKLQQKNYRSKVFDSKDAANIMEQFGEEFTILLGTQQSMSTGLDGLQHKCHIDVYFSLNDNPVLNKQAFGRIDRMGQEHPVTRYFIRANDTLETGKQHPRLKSNEERLEESYGGEVM